MKQYRELLTLTAVAVAMDAGLKVELLNVAGKWVRVDDHIHRDAQYRVEVEPFVAEIDVQKVIRGAYIEQFNSQQAEIDEQKKLIDLIHKDLKMRADDEGVVNISNFIWERINQHRSK